MEAFTLLTDDVLQLILNKKEEEGSGGKDESKLDIAYQLIQDIMNRRLYKCVSQTHCRVNRHNCYTDFTDSMHF
jgi:hypothetical protein